MKIVLLAFAVVLPLVQCGRLKVQGRHFIKDGHKVFLSGNNLPWVNYARDFGNNQYHGVKSRMESFIRELQKAGGNSMRLWVHIEGQTTPEFSSDGHVTGMDHGGTFISDMKQLLTYAAQHDILIFITLWNGAVSESKHYRLNGLIVDRSKLQSYIDHALIPMVKALKDMPGLGGWDIINEPEGELIPGAHNSDLCFDTTHLAHAGPGWAAAIKGVDPQALVSVGAWRAQSNIEQFGNHNHYSDSCLIKAGGRQMGTMSFYQIHSYAWKGHFDSASPFKRTADEYQLDKPIVIGEFRQEPGQMSITEMYEHAYTSYSGAWAWPLKNGNVGTERQGITAIKNHNDDANGGLVHFSV